MKSLISACLVSIVVLSGCGKASVPLAAPKDVPAGLESLNLTEEQAKDLNAWLAARKPVPDPSELAQYLKSLLKNDQQDALDEVLNSAVPVDPNAP